jgi:hypothetical protein
VGLIGEKTRGRKSRDTVPLRDKPRHLIIIDCFLGTFNYIQAGLPHGRQVQPPFI